MQANDITWLFGVEKYFHFVQDSSKKEFIRNIINLKYADPASKPWSLRNLISDDYKKYPELQREDRLNFYTKVCSVNEITTEEITFALRSIWPDDSIVCKLNKIMELGYGDLLPVIFSKSQVLSKIWMAEILSKFDTKFNTILLIGGWLTHHTWYLTDLKFNTLYSIDPDNSINDLVAEVNPGAFVLNKDVIDCFDSNNRLSFYNKTLDADLIINTSSEHMDQQWFERLPIGSRVFIEGNNYSIPEHINYSHSFDNFIEKYPMTTTLYKGELTLQNYSRYAIYGIK